MWHSSAPSHPSTGERPAAGPGRVRPGRCCRAPGRRDPARARRSRTGRRAKKRPRGPLDELREVVQVCRLDVVFARRLGGDARRAYEGGRQHEGRGSGRETHQKVTRARAYETSLELYPPGTCEAELRVTLVQQVPADQRHLQVVAEGPGRADIQLGVGGHRRCWGAPRRGEGNLRARSDEAG